LFSFIQMAKCFSVLEANDFGEQKNEILDSGAILEREKREREKRGTCCCNVQGRQCGVRGGNSVRCTKLSGRRDCEGCHQGWKC